jgi:hypothetical protein
MATKTKGKKLSGNPVRRAEQLEELDANALRRSPQCECRHPERCRRVARFRFSYLCAEDGCGVAVSVHLGCVDCKDSWVRHAREDGHRVRVTPL